MDEEGEELLEAGWYIRGARDDPGCAVAHGLEKQDAWVPSNRAEMSVGGWGRAVQHIRMTGIFHPILL